MFSRHGYVFCIDNADFVMKKYPELRSRILNDQNDNYFILAGRCDFRLPKTKDDYKLLKFDSDKKEFSLVYRNCLGGIW